MAAPAVRHAEHHHQARNDQDELLAIDEAAAEGVAEAAEVELAADVADAGPPPGAHRPAQSLVG